jgi:hypothetical protein
MEMSELYTSLPKELMTVEEEWAIFKNSILQASKELGGTMKQLKPGKKKTPWWNNTIKEAIQEKKIQKMDKE